MKLILDKSESGYAVYFTWHKDSAKYIGDFEPDDAGFYVWWTNRNNGYMDAKFLQLIVDKLNELNAEWEKQVNNICGEENE